MFKPNLLLRYEAWWVCFHKARAVKSRVLQSTSSRLQLCGLFTTQPSFHFYLFNSVGFGAKWSYFYILGQQVFNSTVYHVTLQSFLQELSMACAISPVWQLWMPESPPHTLHYFFLLQKEMGLFDVLRRAVGWVAASQRPTTNNCVLWFLRRSSYHCLKSMFCAVHLSQENLAMSGTRTTDSWVSLAKTEWG